MNSQVALLLDGGFVTRRLKDRVGYFPRVRDVEGLIAQIMCHERLARMEVFRVYYYDAPPLIAERPNPVDGSSVKIGSGRDARSNQSLIDALELRPDFAVRRGSVAFRGWKIARSAVTSLKATPRPLVPDDFVPDLEQKGVDLRIGLDIATLSLKRPAGTLVLVTGDADFVPAMKHARTEGLKVYLEILGHAVNRELKAHADLVL